MNPQLDINMNSVKSGLYIVSTPIGNLEDITIRAINILIKSDFILCEDTRVSRKLLSKYNINKKLISNHKFNEKKNLNKIVDILKLNKVVSLISDAGTPSISDPGRILINECVKNKINIFPIPGPSAVSTALSISGFSDKYYFYGFFPEKKTIIEKDLGFLSNLNCSIIFFISPRKLNSIIATLKMYFKNRNIVICREISKYYEEYIRSSINELTSFEKAIKGEITIVISEKPNNDKELNVLNESDKKKIQKLIKKFSIKDITKIISDEKNVSKKMIYNYCLKIKNEN
tara:strand:- start:1947 stop:2810 length:864 start_codon:yes stop_codon:yes gene_type:complete